MKTRLAFATLSILLLAGLAVVWAQPPFGPPRGPGFRGGPGGPPRFGGPPGRRPRVQGQPDQTVPQRSEAEDAKADHGLIQNADLEIASTDGRTPRGFDVGGDVIYSYLGDPTKDRTGWGVRLLSGRDVNEDGRREAHLTTTVHLPPSETSRWYRFSIRDLAQEEFSSQSQKLFLKVEFFAGGGKNSLDSISQNLYGALLRVRHDLPSGDEGPSASAIWRTHAMEFRTPFPEVDTLRLTVGFSDGDGVGKRSEFLIDELDLRSIPTPDEYVAPKADNGRRIEPLAIARLTPLGGRWYYDPRGGDPKPPRQFDHTNADRLYYLTDRLETPFAGNMSAWLKRGWLDDHGKIIDQDRYVADNVLIGFTQTHLVMHTHNLPNHPTAVFPDVTRSLDGNPNYIQEQNLTYYLPLEPRMNPRRRAMTGYNDRNVMNPGPIGVATNGVVFFDPYDADTVPALWRLDRCCGHPSPMSQYHYHKYPVCVKSPWADNGEGHSPLIGFAFDGFPLYGPYESAGVMAKDLEENPLNEFNVHYDEARGWHYHVTPGKFPHIIGGYWGAVDSRNLPRGPR